MRSPPTRRAASPITATVSAPTRANVSRCPNSAVWCPRNVDSRSMNIGAIANTTAAAGGCDATGTVCAPTNGSLNPWPAAIC